MRRLFALRVAYGRAAKFDIANLAAAEAGPLELIFLKLKSPMLLDSRISALPLPSMMVDGLFGLKITFLNLLPEALFRFDRKSACGNPVTRECSEALFNLKCFRELGTRVVLARCLPLPVSVAV